MWIRVALLLAITSVAVFSGVVAKDQYDKRKSEQLQNRNRMERLRRALAEAVLKLATIEEKYGRLSKQFRETAEEVERLRKQLPERQISQGFCVFSEAMKPCIFNWIQMDPTQPSD